MRFVEFGKRCLVALLFVAFAVSSAFAEMPEARVVVPGKPEGAIVRGCYSIAQDLYGPYRMSFCLKADSTYKVRGRDGLKCDGRLNWSVSGRDVSIKLRRADCNKGKDWSADRLDCRGLSALAAIIAKLINPDYPVLGAMTCTYDPQPAGLKSKTVTAKRRD
ncbi:hypothetical protein [Devosia sp.]|uniref:hypothetical protein n=1 Tax=Devosia sp. TaxID=1871048 RepID=UPI003BA8701F